MVNSVIGAAYNEGLPIVEMLLPLLPGGWDVMFARVPRFGRSESKRWFKTAVRSLLEAIPTGQPGSRYTVEHGSPNGVLELHLFGRSEIDAPSRVASWPAVGYMDDTSEVVRAAVQGKRAQARGASGPVLAALYTAGFGAYEDEKFDIALFGRTVVTMDSSELGFDPSGAFGRGDGAPTLAGALAFANLGMRGGPDPILYVHPRFDGSLPSAMMSLERRELAASRIGDTPAIEPGRMMSLGWPEA